MVAGAMNPAHLRARCVGAALVLALAAWCMAQTAVAGDCVLPYSGEDSGGHSPPSLSGQVAAVPRGELWVRPAVRPYAKVAVVRMRLPADADVFTAYGGEFESLRPAVGQHVLVWYRGCRAPESGPPIAAMVHVCAPDGSPCDFMPPPQK